MPKCRGFFSLFPLIVVGLLPLAGCTTYTWPDGSQETVLGVPPEEENRRYEEQRADGVRYRLPGENPDTQKE
ncbi:hypothetical protein M0220_17025 [Halomonas qinghailakensis]|uniref:DUF4124 domain-containing protein n=2 Tax=Halomonas TaxID=2745 RepID=A0AA46TQ94_9GAMM|nr:MULTISPECIES: hypothetical protein [Halomonas]UYO74545.1 hypothetical protein M0220_17025 [Halomonas sp. ZZQ-149]UYV20514.1 hypothetical protein K1Y77_07685 [Halomonas qaidamensis]